MLILGPFVTPSPGHCQDLDNYFHTGYSMEVCVDGEAYYCPLFLHQRYSADNKPSFAEVYALGFQRAWPISFTYQEIFSQSHPDGLLVNLSPLLREIFLHEPAPGALQLFLRELREKITIYEGYSPYRPEREVQLIPRLHNQGYRVVEVCHYGTRLTVELGFCFGDARSEWQHVDTIGMSFYLRGGELTCGRWEPSRSESIQDILGKQFRELAPKKPLDCFASSVDIQSLKDHVEWSKLLLLTAAEVSSEKKQIISTSPELWNSPVELAKKLSDAGLYAPGTNLSQITRSLPSLIEKTRNRKT